MKITINGKGGGERRAAGSVEAQTHFQSTENPQWEAFARKNCGEKQCIVGRNKAGLLLRLDTKSAERRLALGAFVMKAMSAFSFRGRCFAVMEIEVEGLPPKI